MREALVALLPRLLPEHISWQCIPHEGKRDLERSVPRKLRAWREPGVQFIVLRDQDSADCEKVKERLVRLCDEGKRPDTLVRIACRQLESWFLGDLVAVEVGMRTGNIAQLQDKEKFRNPDRLGSPSHELKRMAPAYQKVSGSRSIGPHLDLTRNRSRSFQVFVQGVQRLIAQGKLSG